MVGKTTLLDAIFWAAYGYLPKWGGPKGGDADAVIKRDEDGKCISTITVEHAGNTIEITRQRPVKLIVKKNGEVIEGKTADLDKRIPQLIGMTDTQFLISVYMPQKRKMESFFSMSDNDRTQLLSTVAGLEELDAGLMKAKSARAALSHEMEYAKGQIFAVEQSVAKIPEEKKFYQEKINTALNEYEQASVEHSRLEGDGNFEIKQIESELVVKKEAITYEAHEQISAAEEKLKALKLEADRLSNEITQSPQVPKSLFDAVNTARDRLNEEKLAHQERDRAIVRNERTQQRINEQLDLMESASSGNCKHCLQVLPEETRQQQAMKHLQAAKDLEAEFVKPREIFELAPFEEALETAQRELALKQQELNERPRTLKADWLKVLEQMKSEETMLDMKRTSARRDTVALQTEADSKILAIRQKIKDAKLKLEFAMKGASQYGEALKKLEEREEKEIDTLKENKLKLTNQQVELDELLDVIDLFGPKGFRTICFEDLIARISDRAGQLLSVMTEGLYSTRIEQAGETGKGEHRVVLRPVLTRGGLEVSVDDLSGGAEATVTLAYDVAISEAIAENSPLFLDEALDGLDSQGKSEALRLLEEVSRTRPVFLIDHTDSIKSSVQNVIMITYKNNTSSLENSDETSSDSTSARSM